MHLSPSMYGELDHGGGHHHGGGPAAVVAGVVAAVAKVDNNWR